MLISGVNRDGHRMSMPECHLSCARSPVLHPWSLSILAPHSCHRYLKQIKKQNQERTDPGCSGDVWEQTNCPCMPGHDLCGAPVLAGTQGWLLALTPPDQLRALDKCPVCSCLEPGSQQLTVQPWAGAACLIAFVVLVPSLGLAVASPPKSRGCSGAPV